MIESTKTATEKSQSKPRLHLVALPHTQVSPAFCGCAYTAKVLKFCKMMGSTFDIHLYAPEGPPVAGVTMHNCLNTPARLLTFGADDPARLPAWPTDEQAARFNSTAAILLKANAGPRDLILLTGGLTHKPIADALPSLMCVEPGVGYHGIFTDKCAFESYAWQHSVYAANKIADGRAFDAVIPNYFDPEDFPHLNKGKGQNLVFLGRLIQRKGLHIAAEIAKATGRKLVVAGAGGEMQDGKLVGQGVTIDGDIEYVGPVNVAERATLLADAYALLVPTTYIEPFGGVAVEAMMAGTPVIASDWGAFVETVEPGRTGYRFRTLAQAVDAVRRAHYLNPSDVQARARCRFSLSAVRPEFTRWFESLETLWQKGWYQV